MTVFELAQYALFVGLVAVCVRPLGGYLARVFAGERTVFTPAVQPVERAMPRLAGVREGDGMSWKA